MKPRMRGPESTQGQLFSYVNLEQRIPADHPLRTMKALVEPVLAELSPRFAALYADEGRPSIPPEQLLRALLLQVLSTIRSERQLMEQLDFSLLYRWFVGLTLDAPVWHPRTFTKNRDRLLAGDIAATFLTAVVRQARHRRLLSREHFTVDGTLLEAWASQKSFQPKTGAGNDRDDDPRSPSVKFPGDAPDERDPRVHDRSGCPAGEERPRQRGQAQLPSECAARQPPWLGGADSGRSGRGGGRRSRPSGGAAPGAGRRPGPGRRPATVGADKGYDQAGFVAAARAFGFTPHVAQQTFRRSPIDARTTRHAGYQVSQRYRKRIEQSFGWSKVVGLLRKLRHRGRDLVDWVFTFTMAAYDLVRMGTLVRQGKCI